MSFEEKRFLGRTGLLVSRMGIGCSYGVSSDALEEAFDRGINYFYFGTLRRKAMAEAVRHISPRHRNDLVVAIQSYARWPQVVRRSVDVALKKLGLDYADVLILGKSDKAPSKQLIEELCRLRDSQKIRFLAISAHQRKRFRQYIDDAIFDILMARYNAAHIGAEQEVFALLPETNRPGLITYTATRWGTLLQAIIPGEHKPTATDCYRFCLAQPPVDICLCGPKNREEMHAALEVLNSPPMTADELAWMRRIGASVYNRNAHNYLLRKLIFD
jgi:aryl-alcohol dehydrogenase-like predicted oxidoreductase